MCAWRELRRAKPNGRRIEFQDISTHGRLQRRLRNSIKRCGMLIGWRANLTVPTPPIRCPGSREAAVVEAKSHGEVGDPRIDVRNANALIWLSTTTKGYVIQPTGFPYAGRACGARLYSRAYAGPHREYETIPLAQRNTVLFICSLHRWNHRRRGTSSAAAPASASSPAARQLHQLRDLRGLLIASRSCMLGYFYALLAMRSFTSGFARRAGRKEPAFVISCILNTSGFLSRPGGGHCGAKILHHWLPGLSRHRTDRHPRPHVRHDRCRVSCSWARSVTEFEFTVFS
jgi:hypothetical protein